MEKNVNDTYHSSETDVTQFDSWSQKSVFLTKWSCDQLSNDVTFVLTDTCYRFFSFFVQFLDLDNFAKPPLHSVY